MKAKVTIAKELKNKGIEELDRKDYREATKLFHKALLYVKGKSYLRNICQTQLRQLVIKTPVQASTIGSGKTVQFARYHH